MKKVRQKVLTETLTAIERTTALDIVLVLRKASGRYTDLSGKLAAGAAFAWLLYVVYTPTVLNEMWWPWEVAAMFFAFWKIGNHLPLHRIRFLRRRLREQVEGAARTAFVDHGVDQTRRRFGVLVFVSARERRTRILADQGAHHGLASGRLAPLERQLAEAWARGSTAEMRTSLEAIGRYFAEVFPSDGARHELSNEVDAR